MLPQSPVEGPEMRSSKALSQNKLLVVSHRLVVDPVDDVDAVLPGLDESAGLAVGVSVGLTN